MSHHRACPVHLIPLMDSQPADRENGPSPRDAENVSLCLECEYIEQMSYWQSTCIAHRVLMQACTPCTVADMVEDL